MNLEPLQMPLIVIAVLWFMSRVFHVFFGHGGDTDTTPFSIWLQYLTQKDNEDRKLQLELERLKDPHRSCPRQ